MRDGRELLQDIMGAIQDIERYAARGRMDELIDAP